MVISYAARRSGTHSATTGKMASVMCAPSELVVSRATGASVKQPQSEITNLSFAALNERITNYMPTSHESFLSQPVKAEHVSATGQQDLQVENPKTKPASPQK